MVLDEFYHNTAAATVHIAEKTDSRENRRISRKDPN